MIGQQTRYKTINNLLTQTKNIRNVSIVAHVDHGKTTLADCLISSNGIIHKKQAGHLRLMDDRLDEQDRGITMKSSSISLIHKDHLINLIDSPGHLEFYSQVSAALRLTDAALLVVDTVQGVSSQTYRVLNQLFKQKLPAILVLNKIDKLITSCHMDPEQAYIHLNQVIQQVNAILGSFIAKQVGVSKKSEQDNQNQQPIDALEVHFYFSTQKKNIVFASSLDNWGFSVESFSNLIAKKLGKKQNEIQKYLWGDYYFNPKTKQFSTQRRNQNDKPVCVDWVIKPIWDIFEHVQNQNFQKIQKIITALNLKVSEGAKKAKGVVLIRQLLNSWLPLDKLLLDRIVAELPHPIKAQQFRLPYLLNLNNKSQKQKIDPIIEKALQICEDKQGPLIGFVSKMVSVNKKQINERGLNYGVYQENSMIGFARIFSGKLTRGQTIIVIGAKPKKTQNQKGQIIQIPDIIKTNITGLYIFNGQYYDGVNEVYGGCVVGIGGLDNYIFKSGTISTYESCISFVPLASQTKSILKVSVSTPDIKDGQKLLQGLRKLNRSDPSVDVYVQSTGDIILNTCGQVHLQKCVVDLQNIYCKVPIKISQPIISFRETITWMTLKQIKNKKYLQQIKKKQQEQQKKLQLQQYKAEMLADAELDQIQKQKLRAVREWDSHVEIYDSQDLTVQDTRYFLKNKIDVDQDKQAYIYKREKQLKKIDHKNRGKNFNKQKFLNLNLKTNLVSLKTPNNRVKITIRALGMPFLIAEYLQKQFDRIQQLFCSKSKLQSLNKHKFQHIFDQRQIFIKQFIQKMQQQQLQEEVKKLILNKMVCFGPLQQFGTNILISLFVPQGNSYLQRIKDRKLQTKQLDWILDDKVLQVLEQYKMKTIQLQTSIKNGFNLASNSGPLANQQMMGVIYIIQNIQVLPPEKIQKKQQKLQQKNQQNAIEKKQIQDKPHVQEQKQLNLWANDNFGPLAGQLISTTKQCCIQSFLGASPRLVQPMYLCELHTDQQYYGNIYNELSKRRAQVISEDLHEFSNFYIIKAYLPMLQSKNLCFDILDKTQGTVNAQLDLDTWKIIQEDPFFTPLTIQQIEDKGLDKNIYNQAKIILDHIRQKKGLLGTQKIVVAAQKQRTLKKD